MKSAYKIAIWGIVLMLGALGCRPQEEEPSQPVCGTPETAACSSSSWPTWQLEDVQPRSERFEETYGLDAFRGETVLVAFLVGWCPYCRSQALGLEMLSREEELADVRFVILHGASADNDADRQALLTLEDGVTPRHDFVMFQDTDKVDAWGQHEGKKDDLFVYAADGSLSAFLPGGQSTSLSTEEGRELVRQALRDAMEK